MTDIFCLLTCVCNLQFARHCSLLTAERDLSVVHQQSEREKKRRKARGCCLSDTRLYVLTSRVPVTFASDMLACLSCITSHPVVVDVLFMPSAVSVSGGERESLCILSCGFTTKIISIPPTSRVLFLLLYDVPHIALVSLSSVFSESS